MTQQEFEKLIKEVVGALSSAGYDPYAQLSGYLQTGDETYITRKNNARIIIKTLSKVQLHQYVSEHLKPE